MNEKSLVVAEPRSTAQRLMPGVDVFADPASFAHAHNVAKVFASSTMVPPHLRGNLADCLIAFQIARRLNEEPLTVMQNIYVVSGRPGWKTEYVIGRANRAGVFNGRITWKSTGAGDDLAVTATAVLADSGEVIEATCDMKMAQAEGWTKNPKYRSMPEHMLKWRSAAMLIRLHAPEVMLGIPTVEEVEMLPALPALPRNVTPAPSIVPAQRTVETVLDGFARTESASREYQEAVTGEPRPDLMTHEEQEAAQDGEAQEAAQAKVAADGLDIPASLDRRPQANPEVTAILKLLNDSPQPASAGEYEGWLLAKAEGMTTPAGFEAIRHYWKLTGGTRKQFGMTKKAQESLVARLMAFQPQPA